MRMATRGLRRVHLLKRLLARIAPIPGIETFGLLLAILGATLLGPGGANASVPAQFTDSLVASVPGPTGMAFLPDGRLLVSSKGGFVYLVSGGSLITVVDLSGVVCTDRERGVLGVAVDPSYSSNRFIYVYYTYNKFGNDCPINDPSDPVNRVSRFTTSSSGPAGSEMVLIDNILSPGGYHNAGDLAFGSDGYLYVSVGDGVCDLTTPSDCGGHNNNARLQNILNGKILRITSAGAIPPSNPFMDPDSGRCNLTGQTSKAKCQETYAWGFRNPYQFAVDPNTSGRIYVNDVGQDAHEEVDNLAAGADYGWNLCEGSFTIFSSAPCTAAGTTGPILDYAHSGGCGAITGAAFVPNGVWPSDYDGRYLFADYNCSKIFKIKNGVRTDFASADGGLTAIKFGKSGSTQALYYGTYTNGGEIHKIVYNAPANLPTAAFTLSTRNGLLPLSVSFNGL